jgi:hypothetical protein
MFAFRRPLASAENFAGLQGGASANGVHHTVESGRGKATFPPGVMDVAGPQDGCTATTGYGTALLLISNRGGAPPIIFVTYGFHVYYVPLYETSYCKPVTAFNSG